MRYAWASGICAWRGCDRPGAMAMAPSLPQRRPRGRTRAARRQRSAAAPSCLLRPLLFSAPSPSLAPFSQSGGGHLSRADAAKAMRKAMRKSQRAAARAQAARHSEAELAALEKRGRRGVA